MSNSSIWSTDRTLADTTALGQNGPRSDDNKGVTPHSPKLRHYWSFTIRLFSVTTQTLVWGGGSYLSVEMQSVYFTTPADWTRLSWCTILYALNTRPQLLGSSNQPTQQSPWTGLFCYTLVNASFKGRGIILITFFDIEFTSTLFHNFGARFLTIFMTWSGYFLQWILHSNWVHWYLSRTSPTTLIVTILIKKLNPSNTLNTTEVLTLESQSYAATGTMIFDSTTHKFYPQWLLHLFSLILHIKLAWRGK